MTNTLILKPETANDARAVDALIKRAFGPGRLTKVSERVREGAIFRPDLSVCAFDADQLIGVARMWDVTVGATSLAFLGPLAVESGARNSGAGAALVNAACEAAKVAGCCAVLLVGDPTFFERLGFRADLANCVTMPGSVDQKRVLMRWLASGEPKALSGVLR
jgi:GNAT superfamily N-acetyltransferase